MQGFELSAQQRHLWQIGGEGPGFRCQCAIEWSGAPAFEALQAALCRIAARHEILRTGFHRPPGWSVPVQVIADEPTFQLEARELDAAMENRGPEAWLRAAREQAEADGPPLRAWLLSSPTRRILLLDLPALCADGQTLRNLFRELTELASGEAADGEDTLQYADYGEWQRELDEEPAAQGYWKSQLSGSLDVALPLERGGAPDAAAPFDPAVFAVPLGRAERSALERAAQRAGTTAARFLLACLQVFVARLTGGEDATVGWLFDGRPYEPMRRALGPFSRALPVRCRCDRDASLREILEQGSAALEAGEHWQDSFRWEGGDEEAGVSSPFLPICFEAVEWSDAASEAGPVLTGWFSCTDRFHLKLVLVPLAGVPVLQWHFDRTRFTGPAVHEIARQFQALLEGACADPAASISSLPLVDAVERHRLLIEANDTAVQRREICLPRLFEEQAERSPGAVALCHGGREISYRELNRRANGWARRLRALGVRRGSVVALWLERSPFLVEAILGIWKAGGAYLVLDVDAPAPLARPLLELAGCELLLTQASLQASHPRPDGRVLCLDGPDRLVEADNPGWDVDPADPAYVVSTSGSSGEPKAVLCHHEGVANYLAYLAETYRLGPGDTILQLAAPSFDASVRDIFGPLTVGARMVLLGQEEARSLPALTAALRQHRVNAILSIVPTLLRALLDELVQEPERCGSVRLVLVSGERLFTADCARAREVFSADLEIVNQYGPTECTMTSTWFPVPAGLAAEDVPLGKPIPNVSLWLLDPEGDAVPVGGVGEILLGGPGLGYGYLGRPDLTASVFTPAPAGSTPGARAYRTGDLGRRSPDGRLEFLGRRDRQVKIRGVRVEVETVESLLRQNPGVRDAVVVAREEGAREIRLVAYLVPAGERPAVADLRSFVQQSLPETMVPSAWVFLETLPVTRTGKVDRAALPAPDDASSGREVPFHPPRTAAEEVLAQIWAEMLDRDRVGIHDDFFDLGGHSLLAMRLISRVRQTFGVEVPLRTLFESPTVAGLAGAIEGARDLQVPPLVSVPDRPRDILPSFRQERYWFQVANGTVGRAFRLYGSLDRHALERSLDEIVRRQESLRSIFFLVDDRPMQRTVPDAHLSLSMIDLSGLAEERRDRTREAAFLDLVRLKVQVSRAPLLQASLLRLGPQEHWLVMMTHHICFDGWSWVVLLSELSELYGAFCRDEPSPLPPLPIQYSDFILWQRGWLQGEVLESELAFWKRRLAGASPVLEALSDPTVAVPALSRIQKAPVRIGPELTAALNRLSREHAGTMFMVLLSLFKVLLQRATGLDDICVSTVASCRHRAETERLLGLFASPLGLQTRLRRDASFVENLGEVRAVTLEAFARQQDLPLDKLIGDLYPQLDLRHMLQVMFGYSLGGLEEFEKLTFQGLQVERVLYDPAGGGAELSLQLIETTAGLSGYFYYDATRFRAAKMARLAAQYVLLAQEATARPEASLASLWDAVAQSEGEEWKGKAAQLEEASLSKLRRSSRRPATM